MKAIAIVLSFAALVAAAAAQNPPSPPKLTPEQEIAKLIAVEDQEGDLKRAEQLYRQALAGTELSAAARKLLALRLVELLAGLGRRDEAKQVIAMAMAIDSNAGVVELDDITPKQQQDGERMAALRKKAAELVQKVLAQSSVPFPAATGIFDFQLRSQLLWLGRASIPEIAAALAGEAATFKDLNDQANEGFTDSRLRRLMAAPRAARANAVAGLAGVIWELGGEEGESHLQALFAKADPAFRKALVQFAWQARDPRMLRFCERWVKVEQDDEVAVALLASAPADGSSRGLLGRLEMGTVLAALAERSPRVQAAAVDIMTRPSDAGGGAGTADLSAASTSRLQEFARRILAGTDPDLGRVALRFLDSVLSQATPVGVEMWLEQLPGLSDEWSGRVADIPPAWRDPAIQREGVVRRDVAVLLWPKLVRCARAVPPTSRRADWLRIWLRRAAHTLDEAIVPDVVDLVDRGWPSMLGLLVGKVTAATAAQVFRLYDGESVVGRDALGLLNGVALPTELFAPLAERASQWMATSPKAGSKAFSHLIANTGHAQATAWLLARAKEGHIEQAELAWLLIQCGKRSQGEALRVAMRAVAEQVDEHAKSSLYLALLSMHDTATLARMVDSREGLVAVNHPYARAKDSERLSPLTYVLLRDPEPPHGFSEAEVLAFARTAGAWREGSITLNLANFGRISTPTVLAMAEASSMLLYLNSPANPTSWQSAAADRVSQEQDVDGPLHRWLRGVVASDGPAQGVLQYLGARDIACVRPQLEQLLAGDNEDVAMVAFDALFREELNRQGPPLDYDALAASKHAQVAATAVERGMARGRLSVAVALRALPAYRHPDAIAAYLGARFEPEAVPALLQLLQHEREPVRVAASEALGKIRLVHEQRSYWERITKGLDASPTSAVEKLLLQGKPGAPAEQRRLAITSLGALGVPEALPFLIEWTQDADAGIAKAAKDAITQIHLQPRR